MNKSLAKNLFREVRKSFGRFLAIFAIMALGSGFFAGLRVTKDALVEMGDRYLSQQELYDYRLVSTLGLTPEDVEAFSALDGVRTVCGSTTEDLYLSSNGGAEQVVRVHTLTEGLNLPYLEAGRMPAAADECLLDAHHADESQIGTILTVTDSNDPEITDDLTTRTFTVVGIAQNPYYLNNQRGTSSLGTGTVNYYIYVPETAFDRDYFTEIFLTLSATEGLQIYSEAYQAAADSMEQPLTDLLRERGSVRRQNLVADAMEEYEDARSEYETEKQNALQELQDAYNDLKQGEADIVSGQKELDDAKATLEQSEQDLENARAQAQAGQQQLDDARAQLADTRTQLDDAWEQYHAAAAMYGEAAVAETYAQLTASEEQYAAGEAALLENETAVQEAWDQIAEGEQEISDGWADYEEGLADLEDGRKEVTEGWTDYYRAKAEAEQEFAEAEEELADALQEIHDIPKATTYVLGRDTNSGYTSFDCDTSIMTSIARVFPFLFFLIAALVCITTMTRMVEENRTLIGTLKALGYGKGAIAAEFLLYSGTASLSGSILGFLLGSFVLPKIIWSIYAVMYDITSVTFFFNTGLFLSTVLGYFACAMLATWYVCWHELTEVPALLMRPKAPKPGKRIFLERIGFLWRRLGFLQKVAIRNVVQYKQRMLMMILGIGGCTALLVTGFGLYDSIADIVGYQYGEITTYDYLISFTDPLSDDTETGFHDRFDEKLENSIVICSQSMDLQAGETVKSVTAMIPEKGSLDGFITLRQDEQPVDFPQCGEVVVCQGLADTMGISIGDTVTLTDDDLQQLTLTVSGVMENYVMNFVVLSPESFTEQTGEPPEMNSILANCAEGWDLYQVSADILDWEEVSNVSVSQDTANTIDSSLGSMIYVVYIVIVCSGALAFIVLYNLTNININERIREIATIKVLGFYPRETSSYVMRESLILTGMGAIAGLFAGKALHWYVMAQVKVDAMCFPVLIRPMSYVYAVLLTFLFALLINAVMGRRLKKINMAESLKSIE